MARNYGEAGTGIFTLALTYLAIFYILSDFGFNAHVLKRVQGTDFRLQEWQKLLGTRIIWSLFLVALAVGLLPFLPFATPEFSKAILFGSLAILATGIFISCNLIFQSKLRYDLSVLASSLGTLIGLGFFVYFAFLHFPISNLILAHSFGWIIIALAALFLVRAKLPVFDKRYTINLFRDSWPIAATLALNVIYFRADSFMISYFKSDSDVGIYNMAYSVFQSILVLPTFIMNAYYPIMLKSLNGFKRMALGLLGLAILGTVATFLLGPLIIRLLTGGGFVGSVESLQILSLGLPAYFLSSLLMWLLVSKGEYRKLLFIYGIGLIANLGLNLYFIPQYSFYAASAITVISEYFILGMLVVVVYFRK